MSVRINQCCSWRVSAPVIIVCLVAGSGAAQTAREVRGAAAVEPLQNELPAKITIDPPLAEPLSHGRVVIQYRTENLHIVPVFGAAALAVSPRVGHKVRGEAIGCVVLVARNAAGQTQHVVASYRPRSALLHFARLLGEKFAGTPIAKHFAANEP